MSTEETSNHDSTTVSNGVTTNKSELKSGGSSTEKLFDKFQNMLTFVENRVKEEFSKDDNNRGSVINNNNNNDSSSNRASIINNNDILSSVFSSDNNSSQEELKPSPFKSHKPKDENQSQVFQVLRKSSTHVVSQKLKMFRYFMVIGLRKESQNQIKSDQIYSPKLLWQYPPKAVIPDNIINFCFPSGIRTSTTKRTNSLSELNSLLFSKVHIANSNSFMFRISSEETFYGICMIRPELLEDTPTFFEKTISRRSFKKSYIVAPRCYCLMTQIPFFEIHFKFLSHFLGEDLLNRISRGYGNPETPIEQVEINSPQGKNCLNLLEKYWHHPVPEPGETSTFSFSEFEQKSFKYPIDSAESTLIGDWCLVTLFQEIGLEHLILFFTVILLEQPLIIVSKNKRVLSSVILSVISIIRPFSWQGLLFPILPKNLYDIMDAPVPFIAGVEKFEKDDVSATVLDLDNQKMNYLNMDELPTLPELRKFLINIKSYHSTLYAPTHQRGSNTTEEIDLSKKMCGLFHQYTFWLIDKIWQFYLNSKEDLSNPDIRINLNRAFSDSVKPDNKKFVSMFVSTQMFNEFSKKKVAKMNESKQYDSKENELKPIELFENQSKENENNLRESELKENELKRE